MSQPQHELINFSQFSSEQAADEAFKILVTAYQTLKDPDQRANYDRMVADGRGQINVTSFKNIHQQKVLLSVSPLPLNMN